MYYLRNSVFKKKYQGRQAGMLYSVVVNWVVLRSRQPHLSYILPLTQSLLLSSLLYQLRVTVMPTSEGK
jgi:hypothetical protein